MSILYGAIEAGGTKFVCAVSKDGTSILKKVTIDTTSPEQTFQQVFTFFDPFQLTSIGIGSFGPINLNKHSSTYGYITTTPKKEWAFLNFVGKLKERYAIPIAWTTDVNAAAYGEYKKGAATDVESCLYITVGTGIGGGAIINEKLLEGKHHPEMGHLFVRKHPEDHLGGVCPYHGDCLEGLASGPAIEARYGIKGNTIPENDKVWTFVADYLAQALMSYTLILRVDKIILGGGVMKQSHLYPLIRKKFKGYMNDYVHIPHLTDYIVPPALNDNQALLGCLLLAKELYEQNM